MTHIDEIGPGLTESLTQRSAKRYAIWKSPAPEAMTLDEARTAASKLVLEGKVGTMYVFEIIEAIEPFTRVVPFPGK